MRGCGGGGVGLIEAERGGIDALMTTGGAGEGAFMSFEAQEAVAGSVTGGRHSCQRNISGVAERRCLTVNLPACGCDIARFCAMQFALADRDAMSEQAAGAEKNQSAFFFI